MRHITWIMGLAIGIAQCAQADIIIFEHRSRDHVTGQVDNEHFNARFVITAIADTDDRIQDGDVFYIEHLTASIDIDGFGTFDFTTPTLSFVNQGRESVGFSKSFPNARDLFTGPSHPDFASWDMSNSIGPISNDDGRLIQWERDPPIETTGGVLFFDFREDIRVTFTATVIPAPSALALFAVAGLVSRRRKRN